MIILIVVILVLLVLSRSRNAVTRKHCYNDPLDRTMSIPGECINKVNQNIPKGLIVGVLAVFGFICPPLWLAALGYWLVSRQ